MCPFLAHPNPLLQRRGDLCVLFYLTLTLSFKGEGIYVSFSTSP